MASRRLFLPLAQTAPPGLPTVDAIRKRLGGRALTEPGAGAIVTLKDGRTGVVLFVSGDQSHVWLEGDTVRRTRSDELLPADGAVDRELYAVASDARAFAELSEGQSVTVVQDEGRRDGTLVEKCRFGALVEVEGGVIVGAAFRRIAAR